MHNYSKLWTQFETQSTAYAKLRMALYPTYLVRGHAGFIKIYKPTADQNNPVEVMTIHVHASTTKQETGWFKQQDGSYLLVGGDIAWNIVDLVTPLL